MNDFFNWIVATFNAVVAWTSNAFNVVVGYFSSLAIEWLVLYIAGAVLLVTLIVVLCIVGGVKSRKKKREKELLLEKNKQALDEFISSKTEEKQEYKESLDKVSSEPVIKESEVEIPTEIKAEESTTEIPVSYIVEKTDENLSDAFSSEHHVERSDDVEHDFSEEVERDLIDVGEHLVHPDIESVEQEIEESAEVLNPMPKQETFEFVKNKEKKPLPGFRQKIIDSENDVKARYCDIVNYASSYKKIKIRTSESGEKFYYGSNLLFMLKLHGKTLRAFYALRFADYEGTTMPVTDESEKKSYEKTPVMLKVTSALALRRAKTLIDDVMKRFACEKGKEKTVVTVQQLTNEMEKIVEKDEIAS